MNRYTSVVLLIALTTACPNSPKNTSSTPDVKRTGSQESPAQEREPSNAQPMRPIAGAQRACAVAEAAPKVAPSPEDVNAIKADLAAMLRPHANQDERFERLNLNWNLKMDMSAILSLGARISGKGARIEGVAQNLAVISEMLARLEMNPWSKNSVWLQEARTAKTGLVHFTIYAGGYPDTSNPYAALDLKGCPPNGGIAKIDEAVFTNVMIRTWDQGSWERDGDPTTSIITFPTKAKPKSGSIDHVKLYREITEQLDAIRAIELERSNEALYACALEVAKGAQGFSYTVNTLRLVGVTNLPTCENIEAKKDGGDIVLRLETSTSPAKAKTLDVEVMEKAQLKTEINELHMKTFIVREKFSTHPAISWLLRRLNHQIREAKGKLIGVRAVSWTPKGKMIHIRLALDISGTPDAILQSLRFVTRIRRIIIIQSAKFDISSTPHATVELETHLFP